MKTPEKMWWVPFLSVVCVLVSFAGYKVACHISEDNLPDVIERTMESVVHVSNITMGWQGSGVVIADDIVMTARHVVEDGTDFTITTSDGKEHKAYVAISSRKYDLGFIKMNSQAEPLNPALFGSINICRLGESVYTIGSPYGKLNFNSVTLGIVSGLDRNCDAANATTDDYGWSVTFTTDAAGHPGNSGCPVFTMDGVVRGILVGGISPVLVYCIPIDLVTDDVGLVRKMFIQDGYQLEKKPDISYSVIDTYDPAYEQE